MVFMTLSRFAPGVAGLAAITLLGACGSTGAETTPAEGGASGNGDRPMVVTGIAPYAYIATEVGGEHAEVANLLPQGGDAHGLELTPRQTAEISEEGDVIVYTKHLTSAVDAAVEQGTKGTVVETGTFLEPLPAVPHDHGDEEGHGEEGHDDHAHEDDAHTEEGHAEEGHDHGGIDPHVWLDPENMVKITEHVRDALVEQDPDNAEAYKQNAAALTKDLTALDTEFEEGLKDCRTRAFIPSHAAFGAMAHAYDLEQIPVRGLDASVEPSAARIAEIQDIAKDRGITTIFYETSISPAVSESIAKDLGLETSVLNPGASLPEDESQGTDYPSIMRNNLANLKQANGCQ